MEKLYDNILFMELKEEWGYNLLDYIFGQRIRIENLMKKDLLDSILPYKNVENEYN